MTMQDGLTEKEIKQIKEILDAHNIDYEDNEVYFLGVYANWKF